MGPFLCLQIEQTASLKHSLWYRETFVMNKKHIWFCEFNGEICLDTVHTPSLKK
jgi:hypothetical protein